MRSLFLVRVDEHSLESLELTLKMSAIQLATSKFFGMNALAGYKLQGRSNRHDDGWIKEPS